MAAITGISWCDATFNPWWGCQKVSPACDHCYAERDSRRFAPGRVLWGTGSERRTFGDAHWQAPLRWAQAMPSKLGRRPRVFCASMGDWLDLDAPISEFVRLLDTIRMTPELDWLLLSKRIGNWRGRIAAALESFGTGPTPAQWDMVAAWINGKPPANVWIGATVIDQAEADRDVPKLLAVPARLRFLSIEPMLGPINLQRPCTARCPNRTCYPERGSVNARSVIDSEQGGIAVECICSRLNGLHWIIAGGESGPHARPAQPKWFRSLRDQCAAAGVPFHFKQWGEWLPVQEIDDNSDGTVNVIDLDGEPIDGRCRINRQHDHDFVNVGKAAAGRLLDGTEHNGFPSAIGGLFA